jgi:signal transduction histidine kinase
VHIIQGDFVLAPGTANVAEILARAIDGCLEGSRAKGVQLTLASEVAANLPSVSVDPQRLEQAIANVIANAIGAAPAGSTVRASLHHEPGQVAIECGYPGKADVARMFDPFERGATPGEPAAWARALGCAISKAVAEGCGGTLDASLNGDATTVVMRLPTTSTIPPP